jgi:hypothetical protein
MDQNELPQSSLPELPKDVHVIQILSGMRHGNLGTVLENTKDDVLDRLANFAEALVNVACGEQERRGLIPPLLDLSEQTDPISTECLETRCMLCLGSGKIPTLLVKNTQERCTSCKGVGTELTEDGVALIAFFSRHIAQIMPDEIRLRINPGTDDDEL